MKASIQSIVGLALAGLAASTPTAVGNIHAQELCGDLGVLNVKPLDLPLGVEHHRVRMCDSHPLGRNRTLDVNEGASLAPWGDERDSTPAAELNPLEKRSCYTNAPYGCSRGYCWKNCETGGKWCWTANNGGYGDWDKCSTWQQCGLDEHIYGCGEACKVRPQSCGCGCD